MSTRRKFHSMRFQFFTALSMHAAMEPAYQSRLDRLGRLAYLIIPQTQVLNSPENPTGWAVTSSIANSFQIKSNSISLAELTITSLLRLVGTWYTCLEMETESGIGNCLAWAARDPSGVLSPYQFHRRPVASDDVALKIKYCGVCFADVSWTRNLYHDSMYPLVPGHEITGVVTEVGSNVTRFKAGDLVGVGTYVNSCTTCEHCNNFLEIHCKKCVYTFNAIDNDGTVTKGGYSTHIVVRDRYCFKIPDGYPLELAAPLLCAGITVYKPMMHHKMNQPGKSLGVVGLGGLGHMAIKFGKSFGLNVTVFSTSESKRDEAINILGVDKFVLSSDTQQMQEMEGKLDFIVDTAAGNHPFDPYLNTLKVHGIMVLVAFPSHEIKLSPANLNLGARSLAGSLTGGTKDIQSMLEYCAAHKVHPKIELIKIDSINEALERMIKRDVRYRFVIDIENSFI